MADFADMASELEQRERDACIKVRKPVPLNCECGRPAEVLHNGVRSRYCETCMRDLLGDLSAV